MDDDYSELKQKLHDRLHFKDDESSPTVHEPTSESTPTDDSLNMGGDKKTKVQETNYTSSSCSQKKVSSSYSQDSTPLNIIFIIYK